MTDPTHTPDPPAAETADEETGEAAVRKTDYLATMKRYLKYILGTGALLVLWWLMGLSFLVLLMLVAGGIIIAGSRRGTLDRKYQQWRRASPLMKQLATVPLFGSLVKMTMVEVIGFGLLGFTLLLAGVNFLFTFTGSEPAIGLFATVAVITVVCFRWYDKPLTLTLLGLVVGAALANLAVGRLISNDWFTNLIGELVDRIPGIFWIFGVLVIGIILIGLVQWVARLKPLSRIVLIIVVALLVFETVATLWDFSDNGASTSDQCLTSDTSYEDYQSCDKDGPDVAIAFGRLVAILVAATGALYFRARELEHEEVPDSEESDDDLDDDSDDEDVTEEDKVAAGDRTLCLCLFKRDQQQRVVRADRKGFLAPAKLHVLSKYPALAGRIEDESFLDRYLTFRKEQALTVLRGKSLEQNLFTANNKQFLVQPLKKIFPPRGKDFIDEIGLTPADLPEKKRKPPPA